MVLSRSVIPVTILITFLVLLFPGSGARAFNVQLTQHLSGNEAIPFTTNGLIMGQVIIEFNSFAEARAAQAANIIPGVTFDRGMSTRPVARYNITDGSLPSDVITRLSALSNIREVYPNYKRSAAKIPNDLYFELQEEDLRLVRLPDAWDIETGS
ncbi:hypothetical protein KAU08_10355, partial [bacterium]|nr:hypothetical protein [bacterium]